MGAALKHLKFLTVALGCISLLASCGSDSPNSPSQGSIANPFDLGTAPVSESGSVGMGGSSYYFANAEPNIWLVLISNIDGAPDLFVYDDAAFTSEACQSVNPDTESDSCTKICQDACQIYVRVDASADSSASFNLSISPEVEPTAVRGDAQAPQN